MSLSLTLSFDETFFTEADPATSGGSPATSPDVPGVWDVAINGHGYMLDLGVNGQGGFHHESIPTLRPVFIEGDSLGEKDINPESLWRFSDRDWSHGSGQRRADLPNSDTAMFWQSKGIDVWTQWQMSLLPDTVLSHASANTNLKLAVVGDHLYVADGSGLSYTTDLITFTAVTGLASGVITALATDGFTVYIAITGHGIYTTTRGAGIGSAFVTGTDTFNTVGYVNGRLMATIGGAIYNIVASGAKPAALFTHANTDFVWVGFAEGQQAMYAAGWSGVTSQIYRIGLDSTGVNLTAPVLAAPDLLGGEIILAIGSYLGFVFLGTETGVRMCIADSTGNLSVGAQLKTGPCRCFSGFDRFMWFGWDLFDTESTGLGRIDLTVEATNGAPAYASDLMAPQQTSVLGVVTFNGARVFAVSGAGFYTASVDLVPQGFLDSGIITYDIPDQKIALYLTVNHAGPIVGTIAPSIAVDQGVFQFVGVHDDTAINDQFTVSELEGVEFEIREALTRDLTFPTIGPVLTRHMLQSLPNVDSGTFMYVPVMLAEDVKTNSDGGQIAVDVVAERAFLYGLRKSSQVVVYQELTSAFTVTVDDFTWQPTHKTKENDGYNGTLLLKLKSV